MATGKVSTGRTQAAGLNMRSAIFLAIQTCPVPHNGLYFRAPSVQSPAKQWLRCNKCPRIINCYGLITMNDTDKINFNVDDLSETQLTELIDYHNRCYWEKASPEISDERYDQLVQALREINPEHELVTAVNAPLVAGSGKVKHDTPMLSLDKAYSFEEVLSWAAKYVRSPAEELLIEPKYDGISASYRNGVLATRGNGFIGENVSDKKCLVELEAVDYTGPLDRPARGEIVIRKDDFLRLYSRIIRKGGEPYKNSRNAVAGIMGLKNINDIRSQGAKLTLVDYDLISYRVSFHDLAGEWPQIVLEIEALPYPMDGIVVKLADREYADSLGNTAHHPRGQIAFKFSGVRAETKLLDVMWSFGKSCLTPVAELEPVSIGGVTIRHASLHNAKNIIDKDIHIGDLVVVERAGDVIPHIIDSQPGEGRRNALIEYCPCCQSPLIMRGPELCCVNPDCFETKLRRLCAAVKNIGIERLGEPNIRRMMRQLGVKNLNDIFDLQLDDILKLEGFKEKSAANLLREIATAREVSDRQVLAALNVPNIGTNVAGTILREYTLDELRKLSIEELADINGVGPERATALNQELSKQAGFLDELLDALNVSITKNTAAASPQPSICFTGKMPETRSYYEQLAREHGYEPADAVTKELTLLVAADPAASGGKLAKARKNNIQIMGLAEWLTGLRNNKERTTVADGEGTGSPDDLSNSIKQDADTVSTLSAQESESDSHGQLTFNF